MQVKNSLIYIFTFLISLLCNNSIAQDMEFPEDKVHYNIKSEQNGCEVTIFADIEIEDQWHINAANLPPESFSIPTEIYIDTSSRYKIEDTIYEPTLSALLNPSTTGYDDSTIEQLEEAKQLYELAGYTCHFTEYCDRCGPLN